MKTANIKDYIDFHTLLKTDEGWKIVAKVFVDAE